MSTQREDELEDAIRVLSTQDQPFSLEQVKQLSEAQGFSDDEIRRIVRQLVDGGVLRDLGDDGYEGTE